MHLPSNLSVWEAEGLLGFADTVIIGGGIVGLSAAARRMETHPNERCLVLDHAALGLGGSTRNAGFACFGSTTELLSDLRSMPASEVIQLVKLRIEGLQCLRSMLGDRALGYRQTGGIEVFTRHESALQKQALEKLDELNGLLQPFYPTGTYQNWAVSALEERFGFTGFSGAIVNAHEGAINTGTMFRNLRLHAARSGAELYYGVKADRYQRTSQGVEIAIGSHTLKCNRLLICTNGFATTLLPQLNVVPARNLVLLTTPIDGLHWEGTFHMNEGYVYFRNVGQRLLIGGARHLDRNWHDQDAVPEHVRAYLIDLLHSHILPGKTFAVEREWLGYLGVGNEKSVILEEIEPNVFCAVRMGGMGVAIGALIGQKVADLAR